MASEIRVQVSLQIRKGSLDYQSRPTSFIATFAGTKGPTPGAITVTKAGTDVSLAQLNTYGGMIWFQNRDPSNAVHLGAWDQVSSRFYPLFKLLPGETYLMRLSDLLEDEIGTGSGTAEANDSARLRLKAENASCTVIVHAFDA